MSASTKRHLGRAVALVVAGVSMSACNWFTAFVQQPKIDPWDILGSIKTPQRGNPQNSVPINGTFVAGYQVSYAALPGTVDSMSSIKNPTAASDLSLVNGRKVFQINCAVCHGVAGKGDSPIARFGIASINLTTDHAKGLADGYIFGMIRNGRGMMPSYNRIEELDRWDVVNYIRGLQGKLPNPVPTGPVGYPGQTGDALPGFTLTAPTRSFPYYGPNGPVSPDSGHPIQASAVGVPQPASSPASQPVTK